MIVTFCGHKDICHRETVEAWLLNICHKLIQEGADTFYLGGYGSFDLLAAQMLRQLKDTFPHIHSILILPYLNVNADVSCYDETLYPPLESVPPRLAIVKRNEWMIEKSHVVVAYVTHDWGGAAKTLRYALRKRKRIIAFDHLSPAYAFSPPHLYYDNPIQQ